MNKLSIDKDSDQGLLDLKSGINDWMGMKTKVEMLENLKVQKDRVIVGVIVGINEGNVVGSVVGDIVGELTTEIVQDDKIATFTPSIARSRAVYIILISVGFNNTSPIFQ